MKRFYTLLILLLGVLSTLMAETYTQKVTVYAPATCKTTDIVFYGYKNKSDKSPYKTISGQPTSMYMNGLVLYMAEIPFNDVVYVKCTYKIQDSGDENSEFSNEITQTCSRYCGLDGVFSIPDPSAWYNTFDEAKYNQELFDLNYKANEGTLYVVYDTEWAPAVSVYSSEYGEQYKIDISANTVAEYSLLGNSLFAYTVADYEVYDRVKYNYESTFTIDWNKPFYYDGVWYAKLSDIPIKNILKEESCYYIHLVDHDFNNTEMYHIGDNIYSCIYNDFYGGLYLFNKDSETKFECRTYCGEELATMNVELKQYGNYTLEFTYNANTNKIECKSELQQANRYIISAFNYSSIYNAPQMELVGENEYSFSLTTTRDKGLYYYDIYSAGGSEIIKDKLIQIPETGTYDITITYNAETQATSFTVNKADPLAPIYLRGTVNNWGVDERYKLTTTDGNYYVATYTKGNEVEIGDVNGGTAEFKIGSGNSDYTPIDFGGNKVIERGGSYRLTSKGVNLKVNGSLKVSKIEFNLSENKLTITPAVQDVKKIYYVNKWEWYNVDINVEPQDGISDYFSMNKESVTYQGYEVYSYELPTYYSTVYFDGNGENGYSYTTTIALDFTKPYYYDGVWYETLTFDTESEGGEGEGEGGEVTPPTPTPNDITLYYVNSNKWAAVNGYVWPTGGGGLLEWPGAPATKIDKTVDGYDVYSYTFDSTAADHIIFNAGSGGAQTKDLLVNAAKPYYYNGVWYETLTFDGEQGGEEGGDDTGDVEIGEPANLYIIGALTGWNADATWQFSTADDEYFVLSFPKGQEQELSGLFKVASSNWSPYNFGAPLDLGSVEAGKEYVLEYNVATNLSIANIIKVSKIEFTLSTQTLKITGATEEKVFDTTSDYGFYLYADYKDYPFTFKGNGVYEYDYTSEGPSSTIGDYQYKTVEWGRNSTGNQVTLGELYQLGLSNHSISFPDATTGQTLTIVLTVSSDWSATILVKDKSSEEGGGDDEEGDDPFVPETPAYVVRGNGGSDATGIWCGGIEWTADDSPVNNMTDADKDGIYEVTYKNVPAGTWNFKVVGTTEGWMGSDYLDTENSSAGYTTAPYDGNIGFSLNAPADVTIKFNTLTGKIIVTTPSGNFGKVKIDYFSVANTDECLVENRFTAANNNTLKYTENIQILEGNEYGYAVYRILGNCNYAVYENSLLVEVTESGIYDITIVFNGDYENPDFTVTAVKQGGTIDPDPVVAIKNLMIQPFEQVLPNTTTTTVATFTLQNANTATVSIEGLDADFFEIGEQNIGNGECSVSIVFKPIVKGVYYATLVVTTDDEISLSIDFAAAAGDETFEPGDVPELNPDPVNPGTPDDEVSVEEVPAVIIYAKEGTVYSEVDFEIYSLAGVNVTSQNGSLQGVYIVKTAEGNRLISVW